MADQDTMVETLKPHTRTEEPVGSSERRVFEGERYLTTEGLARRRTRQDIVEIVGTKPQKNEAPENKAIEPDLEDKAETDEEPEEVTEEVTEEVAATDSAQKLADDEGVDLREVEGTGKDGKVTVYDVRDHIE